MNWAEYLGIYAAMFVTSPPFIVAGGLFGAAGLALGWWLGRSVGDRRPRRGAVVVVRDEP